MEHKNASINKRHAPTNWRVLNIAELSTITVGADDVEKTAYIVDDGTGEPTTYMLTNYDPPTWKPSVSGTGGGGGAAVWGAIGGTITNQTDLIDYFESYGYTKAQIDQFMGEYYTSLQTDTILSSKADLVGGVVPASQLPSYVDDVLEYANLADLSVTGEAGKIYITLDTNRQYRWGGSSYIDITGFVDSVNGRTGAVVVTKADVGLSNVDNTSDANKPVSTATQTALNTVDDKITDMNESGFLSWTGSGNYWSSNTGAGTFTILRGGTGRIASELVSWAGNQTISIPTGVTSYVYIDSNGIIGATTNPSLVYGLTIPLFEVYRTPSGGIFPTKENHPYEFESGASQYLHNIVGTVFQDGSFDMVRITTGTGGAITDRQVKIVGSDVLEDHGLRTTISDSAGAAVTKYFAFKNNAGVWDLYSTSSQFPMVYNNAGTVMAISNGSYGVFRVYALKDSLNTSTPLWVCVIHNAQSGNLSGAQNIVNQGLAAQPDGEFLKMEVCQAGYVIVRNSGGGYIQSITMDRRTLRTGTTNGVISNLTVNHIVDASGFNGNLSVTDTNVQTALQTIDDLSVATNLNGLSDVEITTPTHKQTLTYNGTAARWENQSVTGITPPAVGVVAADTSTGEAATMQNITDLTFSLEANSVYEVRAHLTFQSSSTTGYVFGFTAPADSRPSCLFTGGTQTTTSVNYSHFSSPASITNSTIAVTAGSVPAANTNVTSVIEGLIQTVNAGTLTLQYRSAAGGTTITLKAGSIAVLERIK